MKTHHEEYEVYASRVSPEMAAMTKAKGGITGIKHLKNSGQQLKAMCLFCEEERDFMPQYWIDHLRSHTGEYHRRCHLCLRPACFHMHCSFPTELIDIRLNLYVNNLYAYLCRKCNYLQIDKKNIERHLQEQHEISDQSEQKKYYRKFMLLPALNNLSFTYPDGRGKFYFQIPTYVFTKQKFDFFLFCHLIRSQSDKNTIQWKASRTSAIVESRASPTAITKSNYGFGKSCHSSRR